MKIIYLTFIVPILSFSSDCDQLFYKTTPQQNYLNLVSEPSTKEFLKDSEIRILFNKTLINPVSTLDRLKDYDPSGAIGFCFGRAMSAHLTARSMGLNEESIKKLFIVGDLRSNPQFPEWRFHVTTLVRSKNGWVAIDPIMHQALPVENWMKNVRLGWDSWGNTQKAIFYLTEAEIVIPDLTNLPETDKETGSNIIELSFDPEKVQFPKLEFSNEIVFQPNSNDQVRYFQKAPSPFNFHEALINGSSFNYNNYFKDLLDHFMGIAPSIPSAVVLKSSTVPKPPIPSRTKFRLAR